ncbi:MAG: shikimate dehydrogenase [Pseudomonadota bacterium]|nr:shikimate dehydrogenase [Pseudomonadota bacterium]
MTQPTALPQLPLAGVIGAPIAHSKSPVLFRHWLDQMGMTGHYVPLHIEPEDMKEALKTLPKMGFRGVNATLPHKEMAMDLADEISDRAQKIGAANTLTFRPDGTLHADNTDGFGFLENLRQSAPDWDPASGPAVILGAGGAARAVICSLLDAGVPRLILSNRTRARAEDLAQAFDGDIEVIDWGKAPARLGDGRLVVNTTALGMAGKAPLEMDLSELHADQLVTDIVYTPLETDLLRTAAARGCQTVDGLGMLLHQAVPGFERWFGATPVVTDATRKAVLA